MQALLEVILPVFIVIGFGYLSVWRKWFSDAGVDALMRFTQAFAIPCLLFRAIANLDLQTYFNPPILISYYLAATIGFLLAMTLARTVFGRAWPDSVAIGFVCLFSNSVLLGLPITERAFGEAALAANYAIVAINAPYCYIVGIAAMEVARNAGGGIAATGKRIFNAIFHNSLIIGIGLGFFVNLTGLPLPGVLTDAIDMMIRAAIPAALFGLGGVLVRYRPEGDLKTILMVCFVSLIITPAVTWGLAQALDLSRDAFRSALLTSAMAPGINSYLFANMYGAARRVAASSVLFGTALSIPTIWLWLLILP